MQRQLSPVVSVVWTYNGMSAQEMQDRILIKHERQMASLVDDIERIEANSYTGVGVIKVYLHEGADVSRAISQLSSCAQTVLKSVSRNITPPLIVRYSATDVSVIPLSLASRFLPDQHLTDIGQQVLRPNLAGRSISPDGCPYRPYAASEAGMRNRKFGRATDMRTLPDSFRMSAVKGPVRWRNQEVQ
jgi:hypothetical protein